MSSAEGITEAAAENGRGEIGLVVNGEARRVASGLSIMDWLATLDLDPRTVAVERNGEILSRARFSETHLVDGDRLELVHFVQGG